MRYLLDSVVLIDHFNGIPEATTFLADHREEAAVSVISRAEVLVGFDGESRTLARGLLDRFPTLPIERPLADLAAELRQRPQNPGIGPPFAVSSRRAGPRRPGAPTP